jgi:hypothetical protein
MCHLSSTRVTHRRCRAVYQILESQCPSIPLYVKSLSSEFFENFGETCKAQGGWSTTLYGHKECVLYMHTCKAQGGWSTTLAQSLHSHLKSKLGICKLGACVCMCVCVHTVFVSYR